MTERIGHIIIDKTYYKGKDLYSDGSIEDFLLETCKQNRQAEVLNKSKEWPVLYHLSDIRENILDWYPISKNDDVLEIGSGCGAITGLLSRKAKTVTCIELSEKRSLINAYRNKDCDNVRIILGNFEDIVIENKYDYITLIGVWEYAGLYISGDDPYKLMLKMLRSYLKENGRIIIAIENKMGIKYWNGALEDHNGLRYGGLNDYIGSKKVRTFSKKETEEILNEVGFNKSQFYYPMADYKLPDVIYTDEIMPEPGELRYYRCDYSDPRIYNFNDAVVCDQLCRDHIFSYFANSFLIICGEEEKKIVYAKYNRSRRKKYRISTIVYKEDGKYYVRKKALNPEAEKHILGLQEKEEKFSGSKGKLHVVKGEIRGKEYQTEYIAGMDIDLYLFNLRHMKEKLVEEICKIITDYLIPDEAELMDFQLTDEFRDVFGSIVPEHCKSLKVTNVDTIFSNLRLCDDKMYCFDNEWVFDFPIPYEYVIWRVLLDFYEKYLAYLKSYISWPDFIHCFGISNENDGIYRKMDICFNHYVYGDRFYLDNYKQIVINNNITWS